MHKIAFVRKTKKSFLFFARMEVPWVTLKIGNATHYVKSQHVPEIQYFILLIFCQINQGSNVNNLMDKITKIR